MKTRADLALSVCEGLTDDQLRTLHKMGGVPKLIKKLEEVRSVIGSTGLMIEKAIPQIERVVAENQALKRRKGTT